MEAQRILKGSSGLEVQAWLGYRLLFCVQGACDSALQSSRKYIEAPTGVRVEAANWLDETAMVLSSLGEGHCVGVETPA